MVIYCGTHIHSNLNLQSVKLNLQSVNVNFIGLKAKMLRWKNFKAANFAHDRSNK